MKLSNKKTITFVAVLAVTILAIGFLFYQSHQMVQVELFSAAIDQPAAIQKAGADQQCQGQRENGTQLEPVPNQPTAEPAKPAPADGIDQASTQDSEQQCPDFLLQENGGNKQMKTVGLIRAKETGIYLFPEGITIDQVVDIQRNGQPVGFGRYKAVDGGIDIFDSDVNDPNEVVTVGVEE